LSERHAHESATEIFYVRSGVLSIFFDADQPGSMPPAVVSAASAAASSSDAPPVAVNGTLLYELRAHDSVTIPPKRWHRMANLADETLELVYLTLLTP
jgi:mannose-6-phosphate isomerase-like protein (cupin superfamily)